MKINNLGGINVNPYKKSLNKLENAKTSAKADKVEISTEAKELRQMSKITTERLAKVEALREEVQTGNYKVDSKAIAKSVLDYYSKN